MVSSLGLLDLAQVQQVAAPARRPRLHLAPELLQVDLGRWATIGRRHDWDIFDSWPFHGLSMP